MTPGQHCFAVITHLGLFGVFTAWSAVFYTTDNFLSGVCSGMVAGWFLGSAFSHYRKLPRPPE